MPKKIYNYWMGGLTPYSENIGTEGMYAEARDMDPHRDPGFIRPGFAESAVVSSAGGVLTGLITGAVMDPGSSNVYAVDDANLYQITAFGAGFTNDTDWPEDGVTNGKDLVFYYVNGTSKLLAIQDVDIGLCDISAPSFDADWGSTTPSGAAALTSGPHPYIIFDDGILYIGNGQYLASLDGRTAGGANGTLNVQALDLGLGWEITAMFKTQHYIGICAWQKGNAGRTNRTESAVFFWDGYSEDFIYKIPVEDNIITNSLNDNGKIYLITEGRGTGSTLRRLTDQGDVPIRELRTFIGGTATNFYNSAGVATYPNTIEIFKNKLLFAGVAASKQYIFSYGSSNPLFPEVLTQPFSSANDPSSGGAMGVIRQLFANTIFASFADGTNTYWKRFIAGNSTNALLKERYEVFDERVKVNYIECFFKTLVSGDSITATLDTDYGTSNAVGTITYASDGAAISKRFELGGGIKCHAFRPVLDYTAGGVAFSKVVVDYDLAGSKR